MTKTSHLFSWLSTVLPETLWSWTLFWRFSSEEEATQLLICDNLCVLSWSKYGTSTEVTPQVHHNRIKWHVQNWLFHDRPTANARSYCGIKNQALSNNSAPLFSSLSPYKIPPPFNLNITYYQRLLRKNWHVALTSVRWFHSKSRLCSLSLQQHQLDCEGDLSRNAHLPNFKDHFASLQPSMLSN